MCADVYGVYQGVFEVYMHGRVCMVCVCVCVRVCVCCVCVCVCWFVLG